MKRQVDNFKATVLCQSDHGEIQTRERTCPNHKLESLIDGYAQCNLRESLTHPKAPTWPLV